MKRTFIAIFMLVFVISFCVAEVIFLNNLISEFKSDIEITESFVSNNKIEEAIKENQKIIHDWKAKHNLISTFIDHEPLGEIETSFTIMKASLENDEKEDFAVESQKALVQLEQLNSTELPLLGNIL
ncbi:MAG: hypothetical protein RUMPE_01099 [Eubacteriales bacterium SKADARSKE-1]|nr:hypothetical protein [Eubacteriales bacterium SKADARSKE-1]